MEEARNGGRGRGLEWWVLWFGAPVLGFLMWLADGTALVEKFENLTVDWRFAARGDTGSVLPTDLVLIGVTQEDLDKFGRWPWTRTVHKNLLDLLGVSGPAVVAMDFLFTEREGEDDAIDEAFGNAMVNAVVLGQGPIKILSRKG